MPVGDKMGAFAVEYPEKQSGNRYQPVDVLGISQVAGQFALRDVAGNGEVEDSAQPVVA